MDFSRTWASNGNVVDIDNADYTEGFEFLGDEPPSKELFNELFQTNDKKLQFLYQRGMFWKAGTNYAVGDVVKSTTANDYRLMKCITAGVSGVTEPTWTGTSTNVTDNTVTWYVLDSRLLPVLATQTQAEKGTDNETRMSPLRTKQAIDNLVLKTDSVDTTSSTIVASATAVKTVYDAILNKTYPVGAIYLSVVSTSPATLFGGTWAALPAGRMLVAQGSGYTAGSTGGEATHKLTKNELPSHNHGMTKDYRREFGSGGSDSGFQPATSYTSNTKPNAIGFTGGNQPHNNMPPYLVVYMWKRTA